MAVRLPRLLDGNLREVCRLMPTALSLQLQLNAASTATMTLDLRGPLPAMHSWVEIYTAKGSAGLYRVTNTAHQARRERTYTLLHGIDTLSDCVWAAQTDYTGTAEGYLRALLACQKAVYWQLGTCQDTGQWKKTGINYDKASDLLTEFVGDRHGYYMAYDFTTWPWTLHWLRLPDTVSAEWRVSRNIHSCAVTRNDADLCTRLYFCVTSTSDVGQDGSGGGTATAVQIIDNAAAQALYGIIEKTATVDTADVADTAAWAAQFMADHAEPSVQITVDGYELARQTGDPWDSFDLGKLTRCALVDDGITVNERVVGVNYPDVLGEPEHVVVDLANRLPKFSDTIASASKTAASASATAKSASRSGGGTAKKLDHWAMVVSKQQEALDGTGLTDLWETGIELDPQTGARLYSLYQGLSSNLAELRVHNNEISTLVTKTGINSLGQAETLYTKLSQTDTDLRGEIRRAEGAEDTLAALIQANADNISAALGDIEEVDGRVSTIEGSSLWMNRDSVTAATGKLVVDDQGNLHVVDGSGLYLGTGQSSYGVYTEGNLTAGIIIDKIVDDSTAAYQAKFGTYINGKLDAGTLVDKIVDEAGASYQAKFGTYINGKLDAGVMVSKITGDSSSASLGVKLGTFVDEYLDAGVVVSKVTGSTSVSMGTYINNQLDAGVMVQKINGQSTVKIQADKVDLGNYATVNQLESVKGDITKLTTAKTTATSMRTLGLTVDNDLSLLGYVVDWSLCSIGSKTFNFLAPSGQAPTITYADLPHYHAITCTENNGVVTITQGAAQATAGSDSFNIAATNFYKNAVAAARNEMGVIVDKDNGRVVKSGKATTKSVVIGVTADEPTYSTTDHTYSFAAAAKAGDTVMQSATKTTGTEAYTAGVNSVALTTGEFSSNGTKTPPTGYSGFSSVKITVPTGYTGLTVSGRTISCDNSSTKTSATISAGTITVSESSTSAGFNTMSAPIYLDGEYIGTATGYAQVSSSQYKVVTPTANVSIDGSSQTVNLLPQTVYLTYTPPTPAGTVYTWGTGYLYSRQQVSSSYGGYAVWRYSDDGGVPSDVAKDWGWTHMYAYERDRFYDQGYHHWYACTG